MTTETKHSSQSKTPAGLIAAAWIIVSIPLAWGIYNTALGAAKLFHPSACRQSTRTGEACLAPADARQNMGTRGTGITERKVAVPSRGPKWLLN